MPARAWVSSAVSVQILAVSSPGEVRILACDDTGPLDAAVHRPALRHRVGEIWRARITAVVPAMAGAFVDLDGVSGFLPDSAGAKGRTEGEILPVRITRAAQGGKGPRLAAGAAPDGPAGLVTPAPHALLTLAALHPDAPIAASSLELMAELTPMLGARIRHKPDITAMFEGEFAALLVPDVALPQGGALRIHPTPALTAIDTDIGAGTGARQGKQTSQLAFNRAMLPTLARQIRARNLSGGIVVDLAGMPMRQRAELADPLRAALSADPLQPRLLGFTALGLAEILRPRVEPPLHEFFTGPHAAGLTALRAALRENRTGISASAAIASALIADPDALAAFQRETGKVFCIDSDPGLAPGQWTLK